VCGIHIERQKKVPGAAWDVRVVVVAVVVATETVGRVVPCANDVVGVVAGVVVSGADVTSILSAVAERERERTTMDCVAMADGDGDGDGDEDEADVAVVVGAKDGEDVHVTAVNEDVGEVGLVDAGMKAMVVEGQVDRVPQNGGAVVEQGPVRKEAWALEQCDWVQGLQAHLASDTHGP
jgi:hypothetical protein